MLPKLRLAGSRLTSDRPAQPLHPSLGRSYLSALGCVHRDLATRNILVDSNDAAKISDFGMGRQVKADRPVYTQRTARRLPARWMSPEALGAGLATVAGDIWGFGVVVWECFTLASLPWGDQNDWREILRLVEAGERLERPSECPIPLFTMVLRCWEHDPASRRCLNHAIQPRSGSTVHEPPRQQALLRVPLLASG